MPPRRAGLTGPAGLEVPPRPGPPRRRGIGRRLAAAAALAAIVLALATGVRWGDASLYPARPGEAVTVYLVSNGFHSGLVLPRPEVATIAGQGGDGAVIGVVSRFSHYDWIEVGWGEEAFYREVPSIAAMNWRLGLRALFWLGTGAVVHVVGVEGDPHDMFAGADLVRLDLSGAGFVRLLARLDGSFARGPDRMPVELGPGLYGPSLFYRAVGSFSFANVCNHWTARLLDAAGVPISPLLATIPRGLVWDLRVRSGLRPEPTALPVASETQ